MELVCYPDKSDPTGEVSQNLTANQTQTKRQRGGQNGFSVHRPPWLVKTNGRPTKRIVSILRAKYAGDSRLTYEKELLNSRKDTHFCKTNHLQLCRVSPPAPTASQKQMANRQNESCVLLQLNLPEAIALRMKRSRRTPAKQVILTKRIIPASLMLFPPVSQVATSFPYMPILKPSLRSQLASSLLLPLHHE